MRKYSILLIFFFFIFLWSSVSLGQKSNGFASNSILKDGNWYKLSTDKRGIYKITYDNLVSLGIQPPYITNNYRMFGNGGQMLPERNATPRYDDLLENAVMIVDGNDGFINEQDYILFYSEGLTTWMYDFDLNKFNFDTHLFSDSLFFFITFDKGIGKRIQDYPQITATADTVINSFDDYQCHELDSVNLIKSGREWVGESFNQQTTQYFPFIFDNIVFSNRVKVSGLVYSRSSQKSAFSFTCGVTNVSDTLLPVDGGPITDFAKMKFINFDLVPLSDTNIIEINYHKNESAAIGWLDYLRVEASRHLIFSGKQYQFRNMQSVGHIVSEFFINTFENSTQVWCLNNQFDIQKMSLNQTVSNISFKAYTDSLLEFIVFKPENVGLPTLIGKIPNQNLHGQNYGDLVIVTHPEFLSQANTIADFHRNTDGFLVSIATTQEIYNEFSSGKQDPVAIRDYVRMIFKRSESDLQHKLKYLLLFGDGSYDMKNRVEENTNFIPTWQTQNSVLPINSYVSDDFFGKLDSLEGANMDGDLNIGIGRLPAATTDEANILVQKILLYGAQTDLQPFAYQQHILSNLDPWRTSLTFIADDEDGNLHFSQTENIVKIVDSLTHAYSINKIYLDAYKQQHTSLGDSYPEVNQLINESVSNGTLILNYIGHGGEYGLASEGILTFSEIGKYSNKWNLPVFITATCEFSRYDNPELQSAGEKILLHAAGGGIVLFTTTRVAFAHSNEIVNRNLIRAIFSDNSIEVKRFGDLVKEAKNKCQTGVYMQNFTLLGDPALAMAKPRHRVRADSIISYNGNGSSDTLFNGNLIKVKGSIIDVNGHFLSDFNGKVFPSIYDKPSIVYTLGNDVGTSFSVPFSIQNKLLYKGVAKVTNGVFEFQCMMPNDISFGNGFGKIVFYAKSSNQDALGCYDSIAIVNNGVSSYVDHQGPDITIYFDDANFREDIPVSSNSKMIVTIYDTSGINAYGLGLGHEIMGETNIDGLSPLYLNDYFIPTLGDYTSGKVNYQFEGLPAGQHKVTVKAWDLLNNAGERTISFRVINPSDIMLNAVYNYPEPVNSYTIFHIDKSLSNDINDVNIKVYDLSGRECAGLTKSIPPGNTKPLEIYWDTRAYNGDRLPKGFYIYTVILSDSQGRSVQKSDKMMIVK